MATSENWVLDSVVQFLRSPTWTVPVMNFIEENCLGFDNDEENKLEYTEAHNQYKGMVEALLGSFMEDLGITEDQFTEGCKKELLTAQKGTYPLGLFQQLWAADNFLTFKAMMVQTRVELELQALHMLKHQNGMDSDPKAREAAGGPQDEGDDEEAILQEVLRKSKEEYEAQQKGKKKQSSHIERVMQESKDELARMEELLKQEREMLEQAMKLSLECMPQLDAGIGDNGASSTATEKAPQGKPAAVVPQASAPKKEAKGSAPAKHSSIPDLPTARVAPVRPHKPQSPPPSQPPPDKPKPPAPPPPAPKRELSSSEAAAAWLKGAQAEAEQTSGPAGAAAAGPDDEELKRRQEHLREQRDKLMAMKKKEREKQLQQYNQQNNRPKSSKVAEQVAAGKMESVQPTPSDEDTKKLQMRLTLAERLKQEVIGKK